MSSRAAKMILLLLLKLDGSVICQYFTKTRGYLGLKSEQYLERAVAFHQFYVVNLWLILTRASLKKMSHGSPKVSL